MLARPSAIELLGDVTIAPITSTVRDIPSQVVLDESDGVPRTCAVHLDHVQTVPRGRLGAPIATPDPSTLREVAHALVFALDLSR